VSQTLKIKNPNHAPVAFKVCTNILDYKFHNHQLTLCTGQNNRAQTVRLGHAWEPVDGLVIDIVLDTASDLIRDVLSQARKLRSLVRRDGIPVLDLKPD
jgi:hypothetical protein